MPTSGQDLVIAGTDTSGLLHIRTFADAGVRTDTYEAMEGGTLHLVSANASGVVLSDTPESSLPAAQAEAIADLKQHLPGWLPPNGLSAAEREQALSDATSITGQIDLSSLAVPGPDGVSLATLEILARRSKGSPPCLRRRPRGQPYPQSPGLDVPSTAIDNDLDAVATEMSKAGFYTPNVDRLFNAAANAADDFGTVTQSQTPGPFGQGIPDPGALRGPRRPLRWLRRYGHAPGQERFLDTGSGFIAADPLDTDTLARSPMGRCV